MTSPRDSPLAQVFTLTHVFLHTNILTAAYQASARFGARQALAAGLCAIAVYYLLVVTLLAWATGITEVGLRRSRCICIC